MMVMKKIWKMMAMTLVMGMTVSMAAGCGNQGSTPQEPANDQKQAEQQAPEAKDMYTVGVVQLAEHDALTKANKGFVDGLAAEGFEEGKNVTIDQKNAQGDQSNLQNIAQQFSANKVDLVCAIATPAAQTMASADGNIPIVATAVTDYVDAKLAESNEAPGHNVTGTSDMNPVTDQIDLILAIKPDTKIIGTIYTSSEVNSELQVGIMRDYAESKGLKVEVAPVSTVNDIQQAAQSLVNKNVDAIYVPTDNVVASAMPNLAGITDEYKLPIICGEAAQVANGGLATIGIDYYKLGLQTGEMAAKILRGEATPAEMPIETLKDMTYTVNQEVADRLGLTIPQDILDQADIVGEK